MYVRVGSSYGYAGGWGCIEKVADQKREQFPRALFCHRMGIHQRYGNCRLILRPSQIDTIAGGLPGILSSRLLLFRQVFKALQMHFFSICVVVNRIGCAGVGVRYLCPQRHDQNAFP